MDDWNDYAVIALRLGLALMVGCILGLNRWVHNKAAGIRTHSLVSIGAATAVLLITSQMQSDTQALSRVLQGLITGIGFLGAGVILRERSVQKIHGLTTAAGIWACAIIGAAFGGGQFALGLLALGSVLFVLIIGGPMERIAAKIFGIKHNSEVYPDTKI